jgi:GT2 family glycosyltransferase
LSLSIIIINYKSPGLVIDCIQSIYDHDNVTDYEIIVVDNQSNDNSEQTIVSRFATIRWMQMGYNAGFARANNEGIRQSRGDSVLLLNPDTIIIDNAIKKCYDSFITSGYVACGVQLLNADNTPQISGNFFFKGGLNVLLPLPYLGNFYKWLGERSKVRKPNIPEATAMVEVDWINGAYLMVKKSVIQKAGLLDEDFFLFAEESEWCSRLQKYGRLCIYGQYNVIHLQGATTGKEFNSPGKGYYNLYDKKGLQIMVSNFLRIRKQLGKGWFVINLLNYILDIPIFAIGKFIENILHLRNPFAQYKLVVGYTRNVFLLLALTPKIIINKPHFYKVL